MFVPLDTLWIAFRRNQDANLLTLFALAVPIILIAGGVGIDFSHGVSEEAKMQAALDSAVLEGVKVAAASTQSAGITAAQNLFAANLSWTGPTPSFSFNGNTLNGRATYSMPTMFASYIGANSINLDVAANASVTTVAGSCVLALNQTGTGITLSGGTQISAPTCGVASNNSIAVPCGDKITAEAIVYDGAAPTVGCAGGTTGSLSKALTADPLASNAGVVAAAARAVSDASLTGPTMPSTPAGTNISFDWSNSAVSVAAAAGCTASFSSPTWTMTCPAGGTYNFGSLSMGGGINVNFNVNNSATYNFSGSVNDSGSTLTFGPGTFNIAHGVITGGGSTTTFGAGTFNIGAMTSACNGAADYSICNTGTKLSFGGPSVFNIVAGIYNNGGSTISLGSGSTNSYDIGSANDGNALNIGGGSTSTFADATGSSDIFQVVGNLTETGGACTTLPAATNHDINGNINFMGGLVLGSGLWAISGYAGFGVNGGGDVWCASANANVGVSGTNITLAIAGLSEMTSYNCSNTALCIGAGFNHLSLVSPSSGTYQNLAVIGPTSTSNAAGVSMNEGASATDFGGALYFPYGPLTLTGGASIGNVSGQCFQIVASQITLTGGTSATASQCFPTTTASSSNAVLLE